MAGLSDSESKCHRDSMYQPVGIRAYRSLGILPKALPKFDAGLYHLRMKSRSQTDDELFIFLALVIDNTSLVTSDSTCVNKSGETEM